MSSLRAAERRRWSAQLRKCISRSVEQSCVPRSGGNAATKAGARSITSYIGVAGAGQEIKTRPIPAGYTGRAWQRSSAFGGVKGRTQPPGDG